MRRALLPLIFLVLLVPMAGWSQDEEPRVDVINVSGLIDDRAADFLVGTIDEVVGRGTGLVILQIDSAGVVAGEEAFSDLRDRIASPAVPLAVWVGPAPAVAYGGVVDLLAAAPLGLAAPGVEIGLSEPTIVADGSDSDTELPLALTGGVFEVTGPVEGVVDETIPTINGVVSSLDGTVFDLSSGPAEVTTVTSLDVEGEPVITTVSTVVHEPGYWTAFLRLAVSPEAAFFFLVAGLSIAAFEFYAIGPGIAAAVAATSLFLAGQGIHVLPLRWWALLLVGLGWVGLTASYQMGSVAALTAMGGLALLVGGLWFVDGAPQVQMSPIVTMVVVAGVVAFYTVAMPTVARSRFSTRTIGREHLVGREGRAVEGFDPDGHVDVDGARWRATAHREAGIAGGDPVRVVDVSGVTLEVEPLTDA